MTDDADSGETDRERRSIVCPLCRTEDSAEREDGADDWMVCRKCGHPWAYAET